MLDCSPYATPYLYSWKSIDVWKVLSSSRVMPETGKEQEPYSVFTSRIEILAPRSSNTSNYMLSCIWMVWCSAVLPSTSPILILVEWEWEPRQQQCLSFLLLPAREFFLGYWVPLQHLRHDDNAATRPELGLIAPFAWPDDVPYFCLHLGPTLASTIVDKYSIWMNDIHCVSRHVEGPHTGV